MHVFNIERNNHYGATAAETDSARYLCTDMRVPVYSQLIDKQGEIMAKGQSKLGGLLALKWEQLHAAAATGHGKGFAAKLGKYVFSFGRRIGNVEIGPG